MAVSCTLLACSYFIHSSPGAKVLPSPYDLPTHARKVSTSIKIIASKQFRTILIWNSTYESFRGTVSLSVEHGWSSGLSSRIESGFSPDSFLSLYSDGGNHTRVFVVSYAHGRILSVPSRSVVILGVRAVLPINKFKVIKWSRGVVIIYII